MKVKLSKAEVVRRRKKVTADEDYFPGVLGNPVTFAARWGLPLSKSYRASQAQGRDNGKSIPHTVRRTAATRVS
ncbi:MAG TPA: hypothetical protein PLX89_10110 [Verrucomicrobiota bacterium]|nr:hypothetical protein [Verrucomicrobiales bacterium]HRI13350.1 hypothetical protein [Verrucomicrobiota bacterium]